jgi:hypothetical protein
MLVLAMASFLSNEEPSVCFDQFDHVPNLHRSILRIVDFRWQGLNSTLR